ncbi:MAG: hypothetical protein JJV88_05680 [Sulfurovum sp.]|nr:hypothetical protein [Sulfurovaceae bacterium]
MNKLTYEEVSDVIEEFFSDQKKVKKEEEIMFRIQEEENTILEDMENTDDILFDMVDDLYPEDSDQDW